MSVAMNWMCSRTDMRDPDAGPAARPREREFFIDNLLVRIHFIIVMIRWTGLAPREIEFPFPGSLTFTFLARPRLVPACPKV